MLKRNVVLSLSYLILIANCSGEDSAKDRLMGVKWAPNRSAVYTDDSASIPLLWDKRNLPLKYCLYFNSNERERYSLVVAEAAELWNKEIGCRVFERSMNYNCAIGIKIDVSPNNTNTGSSTKHYGGPTFAFVADISVVQTQYLSKDMFYLTIAHQFGHVLGLRGDNYGDWTVMSPEVENTKGVPVAINSNNTIGLTRKLSCYIGSLGYPLPTARDVNALSYLCD